MPSNLETVQTGYARFGEGDVPGILELWEEPADWQAATGLTSDEVPFAGKRQGKASLAEWFGILAETVEINTFEPREFKEAGDTVFVLGYLEATYKLTGKRYEGEWVHVLRLSNGKVVSFQEFQNTAALKGAATP